MKTGLLWYDDDPATTLEEKVRRLARHFRRKYGYRPDTCLVHRSVFADEKEKSVTVGDVTVRGSRGVLVHHFWAGCRERKTEAVGV